MPDVTINIKTTADNDGAKKSVGSFTELSSAIGLASKGLDLLKKGYDQTVGATLKYAGEVKRLAMVSGESAEETSRLLQVLDDFEISAEQVTAATRKLTAQGLSPTTETLAKLSDEFLKLNPGQERAAFLMENFGRAGQDFAQVMLQGGEALRSMSDAVNENLILTDEQIKQTEQYRLKMDELGDTMQGYKIQTALAFFESQTAIDATRASLEAYGYSAVQTEMMIFGQTQRVQEINAEYQRAQEYGLAWEAAINAQSSALDENTHLIGANTEAMRMAQEGQAEYATGVEELAGQLMLGQISFTEYTAKLKELHKTTHAQAIPAFDAMNDRAIAAANALERPTGVAERFSTEVPAYFNLAADGMGSAADAMVSVLRDPISKMTTLNEKVEAAANKSGSHWEYFYTVSGTGRFPNIPTGPTVSIAGGGQQACFIASTPVTMADGTTKPIESITVDDLVLTYDFEAGCNVRARVSKTYHHPAEQTERYLRINDIGVTANHPIWTPEGWVNAGDLKIGDCLVTMEGRFVPILSIATIGESVPTYNLHIEHPDHNYYAASVRVHNKAQGGLTMGPGDGTKDTFLVPMANGEYVVRASVVKKAGVLKFLEALNSGQLTGLAGGGVVGHGGPSGGINQQQRDRNRIPGGGGGSPIPDSGGVVTTSDAALTVPTVIATGGYGGMSPSGGGWGGTSAGSSGSVTASAAVQQVQQLSQINQSLNVLIAVTPGASDIAGAIAGNANKYS
jgi:hypothetical protein